MDINSDWHNYILAVTGGVALSVIFFKGLYYSVNRISRGQASSAFLLLSFLARTLIVIAGFYVLGNHDWRLIVTMLVSFMLTRQLIVRGASRREEKYG